MDLNPPNFSKIFHQSSKDSSKGHPPIALDANEWPDEWKTTYYKAYSRLPKIKLDDLPSDLPVRSQTQAGALAKDGGPPQADFFDLIKNRKSRRDFSRTPIGMRELSLLLRYSCGNIGEMGGGRHRRAQPSAGSRFPIEVYPVVFRPQKDLAAGLYHYNVKEHTLDVLWSREWSDDEIGSLFTYPWVKDAALALVMTAVFWRNGNKYGERGYRYILLEAGHIGQNAYLASEALGLKCCALGGTRDAALEKLIDIDGITESIIYALVAGK